MSAIVSSQRLIKTGVSLHHFGAFSLSCVSFGGKASQFSCMNAIIEKYGFLYLALFGSYTVLENIPL